MRATVVTPTHDKLPLLRRTLDSLDAQDVEPGTFEVVIVDDGSTDGTAAFLNARSTRFPLRAVSVPENRGRAAARNRGLERAAGALVIFLDDDMEVVSGFVRAHLEYHDRTAGAAGVGNVVNHPGIVQAPIDRYMSTRGAQKIRDRGPLPWRYFSTNNSSVRREDLLAVGGFDERFVHYGFEDVELALRLGAERGLSFGFVAGARSLHIHAHTLEEVLAKKTLCGRASLPYFFAKHPEARAALGFDRVDAPRRGDPALLNVRRRLMRALLTRPVYRMVKPLARVWLGEATNRVIDYLVLYHYLDGMRKPL